MTDETVTPPGFGSVDLDELAADLAAEPDDAGPDDGIEPDDDDPDDAEAWTGLCTGGPYAGRSVTARCPKGFLLTDRPTSRAWLYDWTPPTFTARHGMTPMPLDHEGRWRAAMEPDFDVIAYDLDVA